MRRVGLLEPDAEVVLGGGTLQSGNDILIERINQLIHASAPEAFR